MLLAALRRFLLILGAIAVGTALFALLIGAAVGAGVTRSLAVGFYLMGSFLMLSGFFVGSRGPVRLREGGTSGVASGRMIRLATPSEREEALNASALLVTLGFALIALGVAADTRYHLF